MNTRRLRNFFVTAVLCGLALASPKEARAFDCEWTNGYQTECGGESWTGYGQCRVCQWSCLNVICDSGMLTCCQ